MKQEPAPMSPPARGMVSMFGENRMGAKRGQRGQIYRKGPSWVVRWWEDVRAADGTLARARFARVIAAATGPHAVGKREAARIAWEEILGRLDAAAIRPKSLMTVAEFWTQKFIPEWIWALKPAGKKHYRYLERAILEWCPTCHGRRFWRKAGARVWTCQHCHEAPAKLKTPLEFLTTAGEFAGLTLRELTAADVQSLIRRAAESGLSPQTVAHWRNGLSALFTHAQAAGYLSGDNPAAHVKVPTMTRKETHALSFDQARRLLAALPEMERAAAMMSALTSLNVSELAGLKWYRVNLTGEARTADGEPLPPYSAAIREHYYRGSYTTLKTGRRRRLVPLPETLVTTLRDWRRQSPHAQETDPVFCGPAGRPLNEGNTRRRILAPTAKAVLGVEWVSWHTFRRSAATWADQINMPFSDRMAILGHGRAATTLLYTMADTDRRRAALEEIAQHVFGSHEKGILQ